MSVLDDYFGPNSDFVIRIAQLTYSAESRSRLYQKLASLLENGKRLQESVEDLSRRASSRSKTSPDAVALNEMSKKLRSGRPFSEAVKDFASSGEVMIIKAGESASRLPDALRLAAETLAANSRIKSVIVKALAEPIMMFSMLFISFYVVGNMVVPQLAAVVSPAEWTGSAAGLYVVSKITNSPLSAIPVIAFFVSLAVIFATLNVWTGKIRTQADQLPPWSFYRLLVGGSWMVSLSAMIKSGVTLTAAMKQMRDSSNPWLAERLNDTLYHISSGKNLGSALDAAGHNFPDREIIDDLMIYADLSDFDEVLSRIGRSWVSEGLRKVEEQSSLLNNTLRLIVGAVVGWFAYSTVVLQNQLSEIFSRGVAGM